MDVIERIYMHVHSTPDQTAWTSNLPVGPLQLLFYSLHVRYGTKVLSDIIFHCNEVSRVLHSRLLVSKTL